MTHIMRQIGGSILVAAALTGAGCKPMIWTPAPPASKTQLFDLETKETEENGIARNPSFHGKGNVTDGAVDCTKEPWKSNCTSQKLVTDYAGPNGLFCAPFAAVERTYPFHKDWSEAQFEGAIGWLNYGADGDYNLVLYPKDGAGVTARNHAADNLVIVGSDHVPHPKGVDRYIELEFDSVEVRNRFKTSSWV